MLSYHQALETLLQTVQPLPGESMPLTEAYGRIAAAALVAPNAMPPFDQAMFDGYALRSGDTRTASPAHPLCLPVQATLTAGAHVDQPLGPRQAIRIMTGAALPRGADTVIKFEESTVVDGSVVLQRPWPRGAGMQRRGAEIRQHTLVCKAGDRLTPQRIGVALALGVSQVEVYRRPRVALVAPGDELLPPGAPLQPGKKWCSNLYALDIRLQELGCTSINLGIVPDTLASLTERLRQGLDADIVIILGASGRGDHDFAGRAMAAVGARTVFRGVATSPGRSLAVTQCDTTRFFGLPGSPWAAFVGFEAFVWPMIRALCGQASPLPLSHSATLDTAVTVRPGVTHFLPARLQQRQTGMVASPVQALLGLARAESAPLGLIIVPPHRRAFAVGARARVQPITSW